MPFYTAYGKRIIKLPVTDMLTEMDADMHQYVDSDVVPFLKMLNFAVHS